MKTTDNGRLTTDVLLKQKATTSAREAVAAAMLLKLLQARTRAPLLLAAAIAVTFGAAARLVDTGAGIW